MRPRDKARGGSVPLVTPRLRLRPLVAANVDALVGLYGDWEVARWLSRLPWPFTTRSAQTMIAEAMDDLECGRGYFLRIETRAAGAFVGTVSLRMPACDPEPWTTDAKLGILGYAVRSEAQGRGFATEVAARTVQFAFGDLQL